MAEEGRSSEYPECISKVGSPSSGDVGYIGSSESVGFGHEDWSRDNVQEAPPNSESGTGKDDNPSNTALF